MNPAIAAVAREHARLPTDQIICEIRDRIGVWRPLPSVTYRESAIDYLVHPQDIAIPLGRELPMPSDAAMVAVDRVWSSDRMFHARKRYHGLPLRRHRRRLGRRRGRRGRADRSAGCCCCSPVAQRD